MAAAEERIAQAERQLQVSSNPLICQHVGEVTQLWCVTGIQELRKLPFTANAHL